VSNETSMLAYWRASVGICSVVRDGFRLRSQTFGWTMWDVSLDGPSRRIIAEPADAPAPPEPAPVAPRPEHAPAPAADASPPRPAAAP
jgi:hypothetical protein